MKENTVVWVAGDMLCVVTPGGENVTVPLEKVTDQLKALMGARERMLAEAASIVTGNREDSYGSPEDSFKRIATFWTPIFGVEVKPVQVALAMIALKLARIVHNIFNWDDWVDIAGCAANGADLVDREGNANV